MPSSNIAASHLAPEAGGYNPEGHVVYPSNGHPAVEFRPPVACRNSRTNQSAANFLQNQIGEYCLIGRRWRLYRPRWRTGCRSRLQDNGGFLKSWLYVFAFHDCFPRIMKFPQFNRDGGPVWCRRRRKACRRAPGSNRVEMIGGLSKSRLPAFAQQDHLHC
jgi:hypothetical protein